MSGLAVRGNSSACRWFRLREAPPRLAGGETALLDDRVRAGAASATTTELVLPERLRRPPLELAPVPLLRLVHRRCGGRRARLSDLHVGDTALDHAVTADFYAGARSNPLRLVFR